MNVQESFYFIFQIRTVLQLFGAPIKDVRLVKHRDTGEKAKKIYPQPAVVVMVEWSMSSNKVPLPLEFALGLVCCGGTISGIGSGEVQRFIKEEKTSK